MPFTFQASVYVIYTIILLAENKLNSWAQNKDQDQGKYIPSTMRSKQVTWLRQTSMDGGIFSYHEGGGSEDTFPEQYYYLPEVIRPESKGHVLMKYLRVSGSKQRPSAALVLPPFRLDISGELMSMVKQYFSWGLPVYSQGPGTLVRYWSGRAGVSWLLSTHEMLLPLGN